MKIKHRSVVGMLVVVLCAGFVGGCDDDRKSNGEFYSDAYVDRASCVAAGGFLNGWDILEYYFVRVNDQSTNAGVNPGADIDAITITKSTTGRRASVSRVEEYRPVNTADISRVSMQPDNIVGDPTAFGTPFDPEQVGPDKECSLDDEHFVSLGGVGGYIIVSFGADHVETGDTITVYEIGNCNKQGASDPIEVQVSVSSAVDGEWITVFFGTEGPAMSGISINLPTRITDGSCINPPPQY